MKLPKDSRALLEIVGTIILTVALSVFVGTHIPLVVEKGTELLIFGLGAVSFVAAFYRPHWMAALLIFLLPFDGVRVAGPLRPSELVAAVLFLAMVARVLMGKEKLLKGGTLFVLLSLFVAVNALAAFNAFYPVIAVKRVIILAYLVVLAYVFAQVIQTRKIGEFLVKTFVWSFGFFSTYGIYQFFSPSYRDVALGGSWNVSGLPRVTLHYGDPNLLAGYIVIGLLLCITLLVHHYWLVKKGWLTLITVLGVILLVLTFSRSGLLAFAVGATTLLLLNWRYQVVRVAAMTATGLIVLGVLAYALSPTIQNVLEPAIGRLTRLTDTSVESVGARIVAYRQAVNMTVDHPLIGVGPDMFPYEYDMRTGVTAPEAHVVPHNLMLEVMSEKGLLGLFVFLFFLFFLFRVLFLTKCRAIAQKDVYLRTQSEWLIASLIAFLTLTIFLTGLYEIYFWLIVGFALAAWHYHQWRTE